MELSSQAVTPTSRRLHQTEKELGSGIAGCEARLILVKMSFGFRKPSALCGKANASACTFYVGSVLPSCGCEFRRNAVTVASPTPINHSANLFGSSVYGVSAPVMKEKSEEGTQNGEEFGLHN